jgi:hypothetical protein
MMYPSLRITSPDPVPPEGPFLAVIVTIDGKVLFATELALHPTALTSDGEELVAPAITPPTTPPITSAAATTSQGSHPRCLWAGGLEVFIGLPPCSVVGTSYRV